MMRVAFVGFLFLLFTVSVSYGCRAKINWGSTFKKDNVRTKCSSDDSAPYVGGFNRSSKVGSKDTVDRIGDAWCFAPFETNPSSKTDCTTVSWNMNSDTEVRCGSGYYLSGLYKSVGSGLSSITEATCCRPKGISTRWNNCKNRLVSFDDAGMSACDYGSFIVGIDKNDCDELNCIKAFECCGGV